MEDGVDARCGRGVARRSMASVWPARAERVAPAGYGARRWTSPTSCTRSRRRSSPRPRNALAKELKAAGDKDGAAEVSQAAAAERRRARAEPGGARAPRPDRGGARRRASRCGRRREAAAEGDASGLRDATAAERAAAQAVAKAAKPHLGSRGDALVPALLATLRAGALDEDVAEQLRTGTLSTEHEQAGFGFGLEAGDGAGRAPPSDEADRQEDRRPRRSSTAVPDLPEPDPEEAAREKAERAEARAAERQRKKDLAAAEKNADPPRARGRPPGQGGRRGRGRRPRGPRGRRRDGASAPPRPARPPTPPWRP